MSLTTLETINIGRVCEVYAANELQGGNLNGGLLDKRLPFLLNAVTTGLEWLYELDPTSEDIVPISNYLISICKNQAKAEYEMSVGGGGIVPNIPSIVSFPFAITSSAFTDATHYDNPDIVGVNLTIFINEWTQQWLYAPVSFEYTSTGINILLPGFDSTSFEYTILIQKLGTGK